MYCIVSLKINFPAFLDNFLLKICFVFSKIIVSYFSDDVQEVNVLDDILDPCEVQDEFSLDNHITPSKSYNFLIKKYFDYLVIDLIRRIIET